MYSGLGSRTTWLINPKVCALTIVTPICYQYSRVYPKVAYLAPYYFYSTLMTWYHILTKANSWNLPMFQAHLFITWLQYSTREYDCFVYLVQEYRSQFQPKKFVHLSFKCNLDTTYTISDMSIPQNDSHRDLGLVLSDNLSWDKHYKLISAWACKILGLMHCTIASNHSTSTMTTLYISMVRFQLLYCTQLWRPLTY